MFPTKFVLPDFLLITLFSTMQAIQSQPMEQKNLLMLDGSRLVTTWFSGQFMILGWRWTRAMLPELRMMTPLWWAIDSCFFTVCVLLIFLIRAAKCNFGLTPKQLSVSSYRRLPWSWVSFRRAHVFSTFSTSALFRSPVDFVLRRI